MTAFDTDVFTELSLGNPVFLARAANLSPADQALPVVVADEAVRGRLAAVRSAEAGKGRTTLDTAYRLFARTLGDIGRYPLLPYTAEADALFQQWRTAKIRVGSRDLRIAAIAVAHEARLTTRNARDFRLVPGLDLDVWS